MAFQFKVHTASRDAARVCYEMPVLPAGVSYRLKEHIAKYTSAVINGPDGADDEAFMAIKDFQADGLPDVIAKVIYQLPTNRRGLSDGGELIIVESSEGSTAEIEFATVVLDGLYAQLPQSWGHAYRAWIDAMAAEEAYDRAFWTPASQHHAEGGAAVPKIVDATIERLQRVRIDAEHVLIEMPAPSLTEFALKCVIALPKSENVRPWTKHLGRPQVPVIITNPDAMVQIKEDGVRGRCRIAKASDVNWERVTKWRWDDPIRAEPAHAKNPGQMSYKECVEERHVIAAERVRMEKALMAAKRAQDALAVRNWGHRIQALIQRASTLKIRMHEAFEQTNKLAFKQAAKDVLPPDLLRKLYDRAAAIEEAMLK